MTSENSAVTPTPASSEAQMTSTICCHSTAASTAQASAVSVRPATRRRPNTRSAADDQHAETTTGPAAPVPKMRVTP